MGGTRQKRISKRIRGYEFSISQARPHKTNKKGRQHIIHDLTVFKTRGLRCP
jgi:hypothetical protein